MAQIHATFIKLFPQDVANIIMSYVGKALIIKLQNYFPKSLANIMLHKNEIPNIHKNNYQYIIRLNHSDNNKQIDKCVRRFVNLTELDCSGCLLVTDASTLFEARYARQAKLA